MASGSSTTSPTGIHLQHIDDVTADNTNQVVVPHNVDSHINKSEDGSQWDGRKSANLSIKLVIWPRSMFIKCVTTTKSTNEFTNCAITTRSMFIKCVTTTVNKWVHQLCHHHKVNVHQMCHHHKESTNEFTNCAITTNYANEFSQYTTAKSTNVWYSTSNEYSKCATTTESTNV